MADNQEKFGLSPLLGAIPFIRSGDNVFLMGAMPSFMNSSDADMRRESELRYLAIDDYRCPFDFIDEHPQWFEWHKRLYVDKQTAGKIITTMLSDVARIKAHKIEREIMFRVMNDMALKFAPQRPAVLLTSCVF